MILQQSGFENLFPIPNGVTYNSYFIDDDRTAVVDAVDSVIRDRFMENIDYLLQGRESCLILLSTTWSRITADLFWL